MAKFLASGNRDQAMLPREFADPRRGLFRQVCRRLAGADLERGGRSELDQGPLAERQALARGLEPADDGLALRLPYEDRNQGARIGVNLQ